MERVKREMLEKEFPFLTEIQNWNYLNCMLFVKKPDANLFKKTRIDEVVDGSSFDSGRSKEFLLVPRLIWIETEAQTLREHGGKVSYEYLGEEIGNQKDIQNADFICEVTHSWDTVTKEDEREIVIWKGPFNVAWAAWLRGKEDEVKYLVRKAKIQSSSRLEYDGEWKADGKSITKDEMADKLAEWQVVEAVEEHFRSIGEIDLREFGTCPAGQTVSGEKLTWDGEVWRDKSNHHLFTSIESHLKSYYNPNAALRQFGRCILEPLKKGLIITIRKEV